MPDFPRDLVDADGDPIRPLVVPWPESGGGLVDVGATGRIQSRGTASAGFSWTERFGPLPLDRVSRGFLARLRAWATPPLTIIDVDHPRVEQLGAGGGTPVVSGAGQTGDTINTSGWPAATEVLYEGDFVRFSSIRRAFEVTADVTSDGAGLATIPISPSIYAGGEPADTDPVLIAQAGVPFFKAYIIDLTQPTYDRTDAGLYYVGLRLTFQEAV